MVRICWPVVQIKTYQEGIVSVKNTGWFIEPPYGTRGMVTGLISVTLAYCLNEPMDLGQRRGRSCADPLRSPIRYYWGWERGHPRGFKGSARKKTKISFSFPHPFFPFE
ncbi:hypothetical protein TNCV_2414931 [Trichonephila clavipes]|nr:hypothetical protein TNCV_2414931 [Trichonephila clavipes]